MPKPSVLSHKLAITKICNNTDSTFQKRRGLHRTAGKGECYLCLTALFPDTDSPPPTRNILSAPLCWGLALCHSPCWSPSFCKEWWVTHCPVAHTWTFQRSVEVILPAGIKEKGRQKARRILTSWMDMHQLIWAVWWLAMPLVGYSPGFRRSSSKTCSPASVKKERTTADPTQVSSQLCNCQLSTNIKLSAAPTL